MPWIDTSEEWLDNPARHQIYNAMDTMVTLEIHNELIKLPGQTLAYNFSRGLQAPLLDMMAFGFRVNHSLRMDVVKKLEVELERLYYILYRFADAVWDKGVNPRSTKQLQGLFYDTMGIKPIFKYAKGKKTLSMDRDTLEKIELYFYPRPIVAVILAIRDAEKLKETLLKEVDPDGRMRSSYNIGGTETGRLSSSSSAFHTGGNLQNIPPSARHIFIADEGKKLCVIDLEQAESREVGWLCGKLFDDWSYLDACEAGDLHTLACTLIWPDLPWPGDKAGNRKIADQIFYRDFSYRDMAKRGGHGSNYYGRPPTMARHLKVPTKLMVDFQSRYFQAFPPIPRWHRWTAEQLQTTHKITNAFGLERYFFSRPNDDTTLRAAIAHSPQSSTAFRTNLALYRIWAKLPVQVLAQTHDSVTFQYDDEPGIEEELIPAALKLMEVTLHHGARSFTIPGEAKIGWNWGNRDKGTPVLNPDGLIKWNPNTRDTRERTRGATLVL